MSQSADFYVYAYIDPRDGVPFYIGKGRRKRDRAHLSRCRERLPPGRRRSFFHNKLRKMRREGITPIIRRLLEYLPEPDAHTWEIFFILALGRRKCRENPGCLCNRSKGGDGAAGLKQSASTIRKRAASLKTTIADPDHRELMSGITTELWEHEDYRSKQSSSRKAAWQNPQIHARRVAAVTAATTTEEYRAKQADIARASWRDPDRVERGRVASRRKWQDEAYQEQHSEMMRAQWKRPEYKETICSNIHNRPARRGKFKGVTYDKARKKYAAAVHGHGRMFRLGRHNSEEQAARIYDAVAKVLFNGACYVNFPMISEWWED